MILQVTYSVGRSPNSVSVDIFHCNLSFQEMFLFKVNEHPKDQQLKKNHQESESSFFSNDQIGSLREIIVIQLLDLSITEILNTSRELLTDSTLPCLMSVSIVLVHRVSSTSCDLFITSSITTRNLLLIVLPNKALRHTLL